EEIVAGDLEPVQDLGRDVLDLDVDFREDAAKGTHRGLLAEGGEVRAHVAVGESSEFAEVHVLRQRHSPRVNLEDLEAAVLVRDPYLDLPVESARPAQRRV